ncbi:nucleoside phosphorylase domain-containing protein [Trichoderma barbatum]
MHGKSIIDRSKDVADTTTLEEKIRLPSHDEARTTTVDVPKQKLAHTEYTIGWICALSTEYVAAQVFLDEKHEGPDYVPPNDNNDYTLGKIGKHNVVIAVLPSGEYGISSATVVARDMLHTFPNIRIGLMVGIGGGAPSSKHDIRLGDVVVSAPRNGTGGVFQYDFGKALQGGIFHTTGFLNQPPTLLRTAVSGIMADYEMNGHQLEEAIGGVLKKMPRLQRKYKRPEAVTDRLYKSTVSHPPDTEESCLNSCGSDVSKLILRSERTRDEDNPCIHYGLIASANQVMKDSLIRDKLSKEKDVLCFEMEAAGLMNQFPCLVIRGICDYSDSHKSKEWQGYAAMTAAAYTKDLLYRIPHQQVEAEKRISEVLAKNKDHQETLEWITPIDYAPQQRDYTKIRQPETGRWLKDPDEYRNWIGSDKHTLSCPGVPGPGKTIMTATKVEDVLGNLLKQLTQGQATIPDCIQTMSAKFKICLLYSKLFIVVDALDECQAADGCCKSFSSENFMLQAGTTINTFATAR